MSNARQPLSISVAATGVEVTGTIDESASLVALVKHARAGRLVLDLAGVTFINSIGVREWVMMQRAAAEAGVRIELRRVAEVIVHQLNIVPAARGVSIVTSFYAPYECEPCELEEERLIDVSEHGAALARLQPPVMKCPRCKREMDFADPPELYLAFFAS
jgi:anti-anti-sigma regulatory factor